MHGKMRRRLMAFVMTVVAAVGVLSAAAPAQASMACDPGNDAPDVGAILVNGPENGSNYTAVFQFMLTAEQVQNLGCSHPYLEIDFHLYNFGVGTQWEDYQVYSNMPSYMHDVAYRDDSPTEQIPGLTNIKTSGPDGLKPGIQYYAMITWSAPNAQADRTVGVSWAPSVGPRDPFEWSLCNVLHNGSPPWCIFGDGNNTYELTKVVFGGPLPVTNNYTWHPFGTGWSSTPNGNSGGPGGFGGSGLSGGTPLSSPPQISTQMFLRGDSAVFAKNDLGDGGWARETDPGSIKAIAAGGQHQLALDACNAVYAKSSVGNGGWVQETPCYGATQIAVSSNGTQMVVDGCAAVWAKVDIGYGGWVQETDCGNASQIAVGGNTQMFIRGDAAVFARGNIGRDGWVQETTPGNATAIAADATGMQAFIRGDAAVFARRGLGTDWQQQVGSGNAIAIAAGGGVLAFLRGDCAVFAKTDISVENGWTQETAPATANAIAVGENGRQMLRTGNAAIWAKDGVGYGGWSQQVGDGNAAGIDVG